MAYKIEGHFNIASGVISPEIPKKISAKKPNSMKAISHWILAIQWLKPLENELLVLLNLG